MYQCRGGGTEFLAGQECHGGWNGTAHRHASLVHHLIQSSGIERQHPIDGVSIFLIGERMSSHSSRREMSIVISAVCHIGARNDDHGATGAPHGVRDALLEFLTDFVGHGT